MAEALGKPVRGGAVPSTGNRSSTLAKYDGSVLELKNFVADLDALRRELKQEKLVLVGHSFGGILSMMYAREHPDRVRALALLDSGGPTLAAVQKFNTNLDARMTAEEKAEVKKWLDPERMKTEHKRAVLEITKAKTAAYFADRSKAHLLTDAMNERSFNDAVFWGLVMQMGALDLRAGPGKADRPGADRPRQTRPAGNGAEVHATFPKARLVTIDQPDTFPGWSSRNRLRAAEGFPERSVESGGGRQFAVGRG